MADTNLPWEFVGRKVRPYSAALTFICAVLAMSLLVFGEDAGDILDTASKFNLVGFVVGLSALVAATFLIIGWWNQSDKLMRWGLLLSSFVFATRAAFIFMDLGWRHTPAWISLGLLFASGGAWLLERTTVHPRGK